jgi:hypothetical protein
MRQYFARLRGEYKPAFFPVVPFKEPKALMPLLSGLLESALAVR